MFKIVNLPEIEMRNGSCFVITAVAIVLLMVSCRNNANNNNIPLQNEKEIVIDRVKYIFNEVYEKGIDGDLKFLTTEYMNLQKKEQEVTPEGEIGFIDYDHWLQAQDCFNPSMTVLSAEMLSETKASVKIRIKPDSFSDEQLDVELVLIHERGDWYIDDFIGIDGSEKQGLKDYIISSINEDE